MSLRVREDHMVLKKGLAAANCRSGTGKEFKLSVQPPRGSYGSYLNAVSRVEVSKQDFASYTETA